MYKYQKLTQPRAGFYTPYRAGVCRGGGGRGDGTGTVIIIDLFCLINQMRCVSYQRDEMHFKRIYLLLSIPLLINDERAIRFVVSKLHNFVLELRM